MRAAVRLVVIGAVLAAPLLGSPAWAAPTGEGNFGEHVRECTQHHGGFSGEHNPGVHRGAAGWDGMSCHQ
jgi:hypothetical protein